MRLLICGGRYERPEHVCAWLRLYGHATCSYLLGYSPLIRVSVVIHGCARGADTGAGLWTEEEGLAVEEYAVTPQEWEIIGRSAGHRRNEKMLREGKPQAAIAFPGGKGTAGMVDLLFVARVPTFQVRVR